MKKLILFIVLLSININIALSADFNVLVIGDSHSVGPFGSQIDELLRKDGRFNVMTVGSCGSVAAWYFTGTVTPCGFYQNDLHGQTTRLAKAPTPLIANLLEEVKPDYVIIELSGNYTKRTDEFMISDTRRLLDFIESKIGFKRCLWSGVPDSRDPSRIPRLYSVLKQAIGDRCPIVDASVITKYPSTGGDGVHYGGNAGRQQTQIWADQVMKQFNQLIVPTP
jgi:hypothetical protein